MPLGSEQTDGEQAVPRSSDSSQEGGGGTSRVLKNNSIPNPFSLLQPVPEGQSGEETTSNSEALGRAKTYTTDGVGTTPSSYSSLGYAWQKDLSSA